MSRSVSYSGKTPHALEDALEIQRRKKLVDYESSNAFVNGLKLYQALYGGRHWITEEIATWGITKQDTVHDFALWLNENDLTLGGSFLRRVAERVNAAEAEPSEEDRLRWTPREILKLAERVAEGPEEAEKVKAELQQGRRA